MSRQEFPAADPVSSQDPRPTPFAQAVVPEALVTDSPESVRTLAADARVDRLLSELLTLLAERRALNENMAATAQRCSALLEEVRTARRLIRRFVEAEPDSEAEQLAFVMLRMWIDQPL